MTDTSDVVVIGAGFAGAATAWSLVRQGVRRVTLVEQEALPGLHASGRNAAIARQSGVSAAITPLAVEGLAAMRAFEGGLLRECGLLLLGSGPEARALEATPSGAPPGRVVSKAEAIAAVPLLAGADFDAGWLGTADGVVDIAGLLQAYLAGALAGGARMRAGTRLLSITSAGGRVTGVVTDRGVIETRAVVNAAGAWAGAVGVQAHAAAMPLAPYRRHLFVTASVGGVSRDWPVVWDVTHGLYFRPEPPGLLLSPCDQTEHAPGTPAVDAAVAVLLAEKTACHAPRLSGLAVAKSWAGLRTLTPDGHFVWCAGLGGHGVTTSAAVGRMAADAVLGLARPGPHAAARFGVAPS
jgi:D-arginine dehydrogenase